MVAILVCTAALASAPLRAPGATDQPATDQARGTDAAPPAARNQTNLLHLNFRSAPVDLVLDYLSEAAGFVINQETPLSGTIDCWSKDAVTREEAVAVLNSALRKNGAGVIRDGRILKIVKLDAAKTADLEVVQGNNPDAVEKSEEVVTQIIPVRYANATQLVNNLQVLLPTTASLSVNESANSLILVAAKSDIRRILKIISALDSSIASVSTIKVLPLRYGDAKELAPVLQQLFSPSTSGQDNAGGRNQRFNMPGFGPFGGPGGPGGFGPPGATPTSSESSGGSRNAKVTVVADEHSNALVVSAPAELLTTITGVVQQVDQPTSDITEMRVFRLKHADPSELADQLSQLFPDDSKTSANQQTDGPIRFGPPPGFFGGPFGGNQAQNSSASGERAKKKGRVLSVADERTGSLLVSADSSLMPQIAKMIEDLDASAAHKEVVKVFDLKNADPQNVNQVLQDLFHRNGTAQNNNNNRNSLTGENNPLNTRQTQQQNTSQTGFGNAAGGAGGLGGTGAGGGGGGGGF